MLTCYYGVTCFGGIFQHEYLPAIQKFFAALFSGETLVELTKIDIINADLYFLYNSIDQVLTSLDVVEYSDFLIRKAKNITLQKALENCFHDL